MTDSVEFEAALIVGADSLSAIGVADFYRAEATTRRGCSPLVEESRWTVGV